MLRTNEFVREVRIRKGSYVHIPIEGLNYNKDIWGEDALIFKSVRPSHFRAEQNRVIQHNSRPERWFSLPSSASRNPGLANVMSFTFGPHACIGWRFSLLEMKVFLAALLPHLSFTPAAEINKYNTIVTRPYVKDRLQNGSALPLMVSRYNS